MHYMDEANIVWVCTEYVNKALEDARLDGKLCITAAAGGCCATSGDREGCGRLHHAHSACDNELGWRLAPCCFW